MWIATARVKRWPEFDHDDLMQVALAGATGGEKFGGVMRAIETHDAARGANFWSHVTRCVDSALWRHHELMGHPMLASRTELFEALIAPEDPEAQASAREALAEIARLPRREGHALLAWGEGKTFHEIGRELGVSRELARQIAMHGRCMLHTPSVRGRRNRS